MTEEVDPEFWVILSAWSNEASEWIFKNLNVCKKYGTLEYLARPWFDPNRLMLIEWDSGVSLYTKKIDGIIVLESIALFEFKLFKMKNNIQQAISTEYLQYMEYMNGTISSSIQTTS